MKKIILSILFACMISCKAQIYPLRTTAKIPENAYLKDTNNELPSYEGIWEGQWNNKTVFITIKKLTNQYDDVLQYYKDYLIAKFKVIDSNGSVLIDNTLLPDNKAKIFGGKFRKVDDKYSLLYLEPDMCGMSGMGYINFTDTTKTKLNWKLPYGWDLLTVSCPYYNATVFPETLPEEEIILTKQ